MNRNSRVRRGGQHNSSSSSAGSVASATTLSTAASTSGGGEMNRHNFGNDYCDHFLQTGELPQAFVRNIQDPLVGYPKLQRLHHLKEAHNLKHAGKPYGKQIAVASMATELNLWASNGTNFDVILVGGCTNHPPSRALLSSLPIQRLTPRPSIALLWVAGHQLDDGRAVLEHWGFRRSEDIMYFVTRPDSRHYPPQHFDDAVQKSTWHCLLGLKGTLRRSEDFELINCNVDTDMIIEDPETTEPANVIPTKIYKLIENFSLMSRRLHIVPFDTSFELPVRLRNGWVIASPDVLLDNFSPTAYAADAKNLGHRVPVDPEIDSLRPRTPPKMKRK